MEILSENIDQWFDFEKALDHLKEQFLCFDIDDFMYDAEKKAVDFFNGEMLPLYIDECELRENGILFNFSEEYQTANESDNSNEYISVTVFYNFKEESITSYEEDQG